MVQWFRLQASTAGGEDLIPGWGAKFPRATQHGQKNKRREKIVSQPLVTLINKVVPGFDLSPELQTFTAMVYLTFPLDLIVAPDQIQLLIPVLQPTPP